MSFPYLSDVVRAATGFELPLPIPMFGLMVAVAVLIGLWIAGKEFERLQVVGTRDVRGESDAPKDFIGELGIIVVLSGLVGARAFSIFESFGDFLANPWGTIFSRTGFTYYGGLIFGTIAGVFYVKHKALPVRVALDAVAPAIMIGYAIGRIGCQVAGDGDWGVVADITAKPDWLPLRFWAQTYDNNISGIIITAPGVYPTPIYETLLTLVAFAIVWHLRKHEHATGWLFALCLLLSGVERFAIEWIRVNSTIDVFGIAITQAELISLALMIFGTAGLITLHNRPIAHAAKQHRL
jgi:phosphatidylglycerol---prolipoprotein diacylglyceryl transferase